MKSPSIGMGFLCFLLLAPLHAQQPNQRYVGHESAAYSVTLSPSGQRLASTGFDETVRIWNHQTQSLITSFQEHSGIVLTAAFNPDETMLASGGLDRQIRLWDVPSSEPVKVFEVASFPIDVAALGREGKFLALAGKGKIILWNTMDQTTVAELQTEIEKPDFLAMHQDGKSVAIADSEGKMEIFSGNNMETRTQLQAHRGGLTEIVSSGINYYFTVGTDHYLRRWPVNLDGTTVWETSAEPLANAIFDYGTNRLVTLTSPNKVRIWDVNQAKLLVEVQDLKGTVSQLAISEDGQLLVAITDQKTPHVIQTSDGKILRTFPNFPADVTALALSPNKTLLAAGFADGSVKVVEMSEGQEQQTLSTGDKPVFHLNWHHDSQQLFVVGNTLQRWLATKNEKAAEWTSEETITSTTINTRRNQVALGTQQGTLQILSADKLEPVTTFPKQSTAVQTLDLRSNGDFLISGTEDGLVTLWDTRSKSPFEHYSFAKKSLLQSVRLSDGSSLTITKSGKISRQKPSTNFVIPTGESPVRLMALADNMNELAIVCEDGSIKTFNGNNGNPGNEYQRHEGTITAIAYAPNNNQFFAANEKGLIYDWLVSNRRLQQAYGVGKTVRQIYVTRDSSRLMATTVDDEIRCYPLKRPEPNERIDENKVSPTLQELNYDQTSPLGFGVREDLETGWSATPDGRVQQWRMADSDSVARLSGHGGQVYSVAFSPDGTRLVSVSSDKSVRLWDPVEKKAIKVLATYDQVLYDVVYSTDGKSVFVCGADRLVRELDAESGQIKNSYEGSDETLYSIDISNDGKKICAAGTGLGPERDILVWNVGNIKPLVTLPMKTDSIYSVQFDDSGEELIAVGYNGHIEQFSIAGRKSASVLDVPFVVYSGCLSADEKSLILANDRNEILSYPLP